MRDEWATRFKAVNLHGVDPPIRLPTHCIDAAFLRRLSIAGVRFDADDVLVIQRIKCLVPCLLANQLHYFLCNFFRIHFSSLLRLLHTKSFQFIENALPSLSVAIA